MKSVAAIAVSFCWSIATLAVEPTLSAARTDEASFLVHDVDSPYQADRTQIRVLLPGGLNARQRVPVIYILPVEPRNEHRFGDGLAEIKKHDLHNSSRAVFVAPTFSHTPWYGDHPTDPAIQQETHLLKVVLPFVEKTYPVAAQSNGRLLLGFSKSGWGSWSLLLRHPDVFGRAAAWDAPLMMDRLGKYATANIFATQVNFDAYRIDRLLRARAGDVGQSQRLILTGYGSFREHHQQVRELLNDLKIPHVYRDGPPRKHDWHSGWVSEAVELLLRETKTEGSTAR